MSPETKSAITDLAKRIARLFRLVISVDVINRTILKFYDDGLEEMGEQFNMNFMRNSRDIEMLEGFVIDNIKSLNDETVERIRKEIVQGILNTEDLRTITKRIKDTAGLTATRAKMIARTETNRAMNVAHRRAAKQSGLKLKKKWDAALDNRTSDICIHLNGQVVGMNEKFQYNGKEYDIAPAHVNCRSRVIYIQED